MIDNILVHNIKDVELACPSDCPRLEELEERYEEMIAEWETERDAFKKNYPDEELPEELKEPPFFPECDGCEYEWLKYEEEQIAKARFFDND